MLLHPNAYHFGIASLQLFTHSNPLARDYCWSLSWRNPCTVAHVPREWSLCCQLRSPAASPHFLIVWIVCDVASLLIGSWYTINHWLVEVSVTHCRKDSRLTCRHCLVNSGISALCTHLCMQFRKTCVVFLTRCSNNTCEHLAEGLFVIPTWSTRDPILHDGSAPGGAVKGFSMKITANLYLFWLCVDLHYVLYIKWFLLFPNSLFPSVLSSLCRIPCITSIPNSP